MSCRHAFPLILALCAVGASAQGQTAALPNHLPCLKLFCEEQVSQYQASEPRLLPRNSFGHATPPAAQPRTEDWGDHPLAKFHLIHIPSLHPYAVGVLKNFYSRRVFLFQHQYRPSKGVTLLNLVGGRLAIGVETQQILFYQRDRSSFRPDRDADPCHSLIVRDQTSCYSVPLRAGERRYALSLRWTLQ